MNVQHTLKAKYHIYFYMSRKKGASTHMLLKVGDEMINKAVERVSQKYVHLNKVMTDSNL